METIKQKTHFLLTNAVNEARRHEWIAYREQTILDDFNRFELDSHGSRWDRTYFRTAYVFNNAGNSFQIVVSADDKASQVLGSITN